MYKKINQKWKTPKKDPKRSLWLKPQTLLTLAMTLIKKINEKMKKTSKKHLEEVFDQNYKLRDDDARLSLSPTHIRQPYCSGDWL